MRVRGDAPHDDLCPSNDGSPGPVDCDFCERLYSADARGYTRGWSAGYEQGQRDEREKWEPMVQALTDELLAKAQPDASMGAQYLAGYAAALDAAREKIAALPCDAYEIKVSRMKVLAAVDALTDKTPSDEGRNTG